ncbi:MAG: zinc-ribbon domain-containing protein [Polyangiaceae bacterium]|nr:zinc-ribbon domain-containing protein [Polyangiaceae bacterium]
MKVACQTCGAKYTISDEKVRGKTVKIKCKKCGTSIVAGEEQPAAAGAAVEWSINVGEDDTRSATAAEIAALYRDRVIDDDTYVWREGMPDWAPLSSVDELRALVAGAEDDQPTRMGKVPSEIMRAGRASAPQQQVAARRADAPRGRDLFEAPPAPKPIDEEQATTAFDPGAMAARVPGRPAPLPAPGGPAPAPINENEASGLIDIKLLQNMRGGGPAKPQRDEKMDDLFGVHSSPFDAPAPEPMLMTLDLNAPSPPEPPPPAPPPVAMAAPAMAAMAPLPAQPKKSNTGLIVGAVLAVVVLGAAGAGVALVASKKDEPTAAATPGGDKADVKAKPDATTADPPAPSASVAASAAPSDAPPDAPSTVATAAAPEPKDTKPKTAAELKKEAEEKKKKEAEEKEKEKKKEAEAKTKEAEAAPAGDAPPFDRAAALSALGAAAGAAQGCKKADGPTGNGRASVTFAPSGRATQAQIEGEFAGTSVGSCIAARFRAAKVPAFSGSAVTVKKSFSVR